MGNQLLMRRRAAAVLVHLPYTSPTSPLHLGARLVPLHLHLGELHRRGFELIRPRVLDRLEVADLV